MVPQRPARAMKRAAADVPLQYVRAAPARFYGAATRRVYVFTGRQDVLAVHPADAAHLLRTGLFRIARELKRPERTP